MRKILACAAVTAALTTTTLAEVRLVETPLTGDLVVEISSTPRGPWTPTGTVTDEVLNPSGDLLGDGMPGWDTRGSHVLSAWIRPGSATLHRSLGVTGGWLPLADLASSGAFGQPVVDVLDDGWALTWQQADGSGGKVSVTGTTIDGQVVEPLVIPGTLVGTSPAGDLLHVITLEAGTDQLWCTTVAFAFVPTQPIPIHLHVVGQVPLRRFGLPGSGSQQVAGPGKKDKLGRLLDVDPRLHDLQRDDGMLMTVLTWWDQGSLHGVEILPTGPVLPGKTRKPPRGRIPGGEDMLSEMLLEAATSDDGAGAGSGADAAAGT